MQITYTCLRKDTLDVDPNSNVAQVSDLIAKKLAEDEHMRSVDVHLYFQQQPLDDEKYTKLSKLGIGQNAHLTVVSHAIGKSHAEQSKLTCVKKAFSDLAKTGESGDAAEAVALHECRQFRLLCPISELGELGVGWPLLFEFIIFLGVLLLLLFILQIPTIVTYMSSPKDNLKLWSFALNSSIEPVPYFFASAGNTGPDGTSSLVPGWCALLGGALILFAAGVFMRRQSFLKKHVDQTECDPNDYALFIQGLPEDAVDEAEIKLFMERHARKGKHTEVVKVVIGYDVAQFNALAKEFHEVAKQRLSVDLDETTKASLNSRYAELNGMISSPEALQRSLRGTGFAVVILRYQRQHRECLLEWNGVAQKLGDLCPGFPDHLNQTPRFRDNYTLRITRAPNPSNILWENMCVPLADRRRARIRTFAILGMICITGFGLVAIMSFLRDLHGAWFLSIFATLALMAATMGGVLSTRYLVNQERRPVKTERDEAIMTRILIVYFFNYCLVYFVLNLDAGSAWYPASGLVYDVFLLLIMNSWLPPTIYLTGLNAFIRRLINRRRAVPGTTEGLTQAKYNSMMEPPEMDTTRVYATSIRLFMMALFFLPIFPLGALICFLGIVLQYWSFKYYLLRRCRRPYRQGPGLASRAVRIVLLGASLLSVLQWWFLSPSIDGAGQIFIGTMMFPMLLVSMAMQLMPRKLVQFLCFGWVIDVVIGRTKDTSINTDYYDAQKTFPKHEKYHTTNAVYLHMESYYAMCERRGLVPKLPGGCLPWDIRTGCFPAPGTTPHDAGPAAAPAPGKLGGGESGSAAAPSLEATEADEGEDASAPEITGPIAEADPVRLALEELKYKVPLGMVGALGAHAEGESAVSELGPSTVGKTEPDTEAPLVLGMRATVTGLTSKSDYNGTVCTVEGFDCGSGKWLAKLADGTTARIGGANLMPTGEVPLGPGVRVRIVGLTDQKGKQYNRTAATILDWNDAAGKWNVALFTGIKATVASHNIEPLGDVHQARGG